MKVLMVIALIIVSAFVGTGSEVKDVTYKTEQVTFYTTDTDIDISNVTVTDSKVYREVKCDLRDAYSVAEKLQNVKGVSLITAKSEKIILSLLRASVVSRQSVNGINIVYAYSSLIPYETTVKGKTVNVEIADVGNGTIVAGCPVILGSY